MRMKGKANIIGFSIKSQDEWLMSSFTISIFGYLTMCSFNKKEFLPLSWVLCTYSY